MSEEISQGARASRPQRANKMAAEDLCLFYNDVQVLKNITLPIMSNRITALIGPSGCGKSSFLRCLNRMNDLIYASRVEGKVLLDGKDIYHNRMDPVEVRRAVGMVFQKPNPFPKTLFENVAYGLRIGGLRRKAEIAERVEKSLQEAALWDEVKDRLHTSALALSGGQQQRLCIARALAVKPEVLLLDEPASALDPAATLKIEDLITQLKEDYTLVVVTHNMQQAARISDYTTFFFVGELIEMGETKTLFTNPRKKKTEDYITGRFG